VQAKPFVIEVASTLSASKDTNFTVLVLGQAGQGGGGPWEQAPHLTDSIILFQFISKTSVVNMVSIPRDLYGTFGSSTMKVNEAFEKGNLNNLSINFQI